MKPLRAPNGTKTYRPPPRPVRIPRYTRITSVPQGCVMPLWELSMITGGLAELHAPDADAEEPVTIRRVWQERRSDTVGVIWFAPDLPDGNMNVTRVPALDVKNIHERLRAEILYRTITAHSSTPPHQVS